MCCVFVNVPFNPTFLVHSGKSITFSVLDNFSYLFTVVDSSLLLWRHLLRLFRLFLRIGLRVRSCCTFVKF